MPGNRNIAEVALLYQLFAVQPHLGLRPWHSIQIEVRSAYCFPQYVRGAYLAFSNLAFSISNQDAQVKTQYSSIAASNEQELSAHIKCVKIFRRHFRRTPIRNELRGGHAVLGNLDSTKCVPTMAADSSPSLLLGSRCMISWDSPNASMLPCL